MPTPEVEKPSKSNLCLPFRLVIALMAVMCPALCYFSRQNLSLAITAMVNDDKSDSDETVDDVIAITYGPKYDWEESERMRILSAFFWTYVIFQIPGARVTEIFGSKYVLLTATLGSSILSAISPWSASIHINAFFAVRLLMGVCQAALFPSCYNLLTHWLPIRERLRAFPIMNLAAYAGSILALQATGYFFSHPDFGWEYAFYLPAILLAIWSIIWLVIGSSKPSENRFISRQEIDYIEQTKGDIKTDKNNGQLDWKKLLSSRQVIAIVVAFFSSNWSFSLVLQLLPTYLKYIVEIRPGANVSINVWIYVCYCASSPIVGIVATYMVTERPFNISRMAVRKLFQSIAVLSQTFGFVALVFVGKDIRYVQAVLYTQIILYGFVNGGETNLPTEVSADFGGTIYGIANSVGSSTGFLIPILCGLIVTDVQDVSQWNIFLYLAAGVSLVGSLTFLVIGGNEPEDFALKPATPQPGVFTLVESSKHDTNATRIDMESDKLRRSSTDYQSMNGRSVSNMFNKQSANSVNKSTACSSIEE